MYRRLLICALVAQCASFNVTAADGEGNYAVWGVGRASCHQYLKSSDGSVDERFKFFLMGYLTAFNTLSDDTYDVTGAQTLDVSLKSLSEYCGKHQMDSFDRAIQQLVSGRFESRYRMPPGRERGWGRAGLPNAEDAETKLP